MRCGEEKIDKKKQELRKLLVISYQTVGEDWESLWELTQDRVTIRYYATRFEIRSQPKPLRRREEEKKEEDDDDNDMYGA